MSVATGGDARLVLSGYVEAYWQYNFNVPQNGVTAWRGFDNRHNTFDISNAVFDAAWSSRRVQGRLTLQVGTTAELFYAAEPARRAIPGASRSDTEVWSHLQQANVGFRMPGDDRILVEAGIFLSPIGPETIAVRDNWNWSRSNLFYGLPFYHTGLRATFSLAPRHAVAFMVTNGWNSVIDGNSAKSVMIHYTYTRDDETGVTLLYLGGVERADDDPLGQSWRSLVDATARTRVSRYLSLMAHVNGGGERTALGVDYWLAAAAYARLDLTRSLRVALRADVFYESSPTDAGRIFWPASWMASQTATVEVAPAPQVALRAEYRHDLASDAIFYRGASFDGATMRERFNARTQDTVTGGLVAWF
ncbi:MAG: outer membrane beta-barrel protein [Polyangiales bacterium]